MRSPNRSSNGSLLNFWQMALIAILSFGSQCTWQMAGGSPVLFPSAQSACTSQEENRQWQAHWSDRLQPKRKKCAADSNNGSVSKRALPMASGQSKGSSKSECKRSQQSKNLSQRVSFLSRTCATCTHMYNYIFFYLFIIYSIYNIYLYTWWLSMYSMCSGLNPLEVINVQETKRLPLRAMPLRALHAQAEANASRQTSWHNFKLGVTACLKIGNPGDLYSFITDPNWSFLDSNFEIFSVASGLASLGTLSAVK